METAQHRDRLAKDQSAEITMFQISEVLESSVFNGRRSFLALRVSPMAVRPAHAKRPLLQPVATLFGSKSTVIAIDFLR